MARGVKRERCVICGSHVDECGPLSARYRCSECGPRRIVETCQSLHDHQGDDWERWKAAIRRAVLQLP